MRRHGWELPYHPLQVVAIAVFLALAFAFYVFFVTFVGKKDFEYIIIGLFSFLVASVFSLYIWCAASDPADPAVLTSKKYSRTSEFGRSLSFKDSLPGPGSVNGANTESVGEKTYSDGSFVTVIPIKESINQAEKLSCSRILLSACLILCAWFPLAHKLKSLCASKASSEQHTCEDDMLYCSLCEVEICVESMMHLTCTNMPVEKIDHALATIKANGIQNVLALRGDPPHGQDKFVQVEGGFACALDLVKHIRSKYGDYFGITVAGYPEAHPDMIKNEVGATEEDYQKDLAYLKLKVDAGADLIITQLFYDTDIYLKFVNDCRQIGIKCPIVPGIMPINNYKGFLRMAGFCKTKIPSEITAALEPIKDNDEAVRAYGIHLGTEMCKKILAHGIKTLHLYTLNMEKSALGILANLGLIDMSKIRRPLPWRPATNVLRTKENVRPIFWANRPRSYISRTIGWEQFPHGRWGDTRSPAYGALNDYQFLRRRSRSKKIVEEWVVPLSSIEDIQEKFANFCSGKLKSNPWSELDGLQPETVKINEKLEQLNWKGFLTINSQPAVNGEKSDSPSIGWGGAAGYVYQKAYVEFFCSPEKLNALVERAKDLPFVTYIAVNKKGATVANIGPADVNAVTWGVFPAKEVVQPTVVDPVSFMVWKDEAFQAWEQEWASLYPDGDPSRKILEEVQSSYYLVSVVDNDYIHGDLFSVFEEL